MFTAMGSAMPSAAASPSPRVTAKWQSSGKAKKAAAVRKRLARGIAAHSLLLALARDMRAQSAQRGENALVLRVVGAQLEAVLAADRQRDLEQVDRVEPE